MASSVPEIVKNIEAGGNKMEKQFASLTLAIPNTHLNEQLTPLSDKDKETIDAMDCDQQIDVPNQLPPMKPESYRYLAALSNEEYEDLLKYTASRRL